MYAVDSPFKSCKDEMACLQNVYNRIRQLPYHATGPNSNTYAAALLRVCGFKFHPITIKYDFWECICDPPGPQICVHHVGSVTYNRPPGAVGWEAAGYGDNVEGGPPMSGR
jgi:hypothetical protein